MEEGRITLNGERYELVHDEGLLPRGTRAYSVNLRPSQPTDPGVHKVARWDINGFGHSQETDEGYLGTDYADNLDTRYTKLLTSAPARNTVDLSSLDPTPGVLKLPFYMQRRLGGFITGETKHKTEQQGYLLFSRGQAVSVVDPSDMSLKSTVGRSAPVLGMVSWRGKTRIGYGRTLQMESVDSITGWGLQTSTITGKYAKAMTVGNDRWWGVNGESGTENRLFYSLDDMSTFSNPFVVGDPDIQATGIGTTGPFTASGNELGASSFTDAGKPQTLIESVKDFRSTDNGASFASLWGWLYTTTKVGLFAIDVQRVFANPVGPGEGLDGQDFEGAIDGYPTAVAAFKDSLWVAYLTTAGDTYILRGMFGPDTPSSGRPVWFPFYKITGKTCRLITGTGLRTNPTLIVGEDDDISYFTLGRRGRDIADSNYVFSTTGGTWYGAKMTRSSNMHKNIRYFVMLVDGVDASNTWQVAVSVDGGAYVNVGSPITSSGHKFIYPSSGGVPLTTVNGHTFKPRLTQVAASSSAPPQVRAFEMVYDERPDVIEEVRVAVQIGASGTDYTNLTSLMSPHGSGGSPIAVQLPGEIDTKYAFVTGVDEVKDIRGDAVRTALLTLQVWETS